nr:MAG TPA: hypothetical protein [Bacteriophage sp.]
MYELYSWLSQEVNRRRMTSLRRFVIIVDTIINDILNTKKKRHVIGGVLISMSLTFGVLAFTVLTL